MSYNESLSKNSNYPAMTQSQWDSAPFNEPVIPERDFTIEATYTMVKTGVDVCTDNYIPEYDEEDGRTYCNTEDTDWEDVYSSVHYSIPEMLDKLKQYVEQDLSMTGKNSTKGRELQRLLEDCQGWTVEDSYFIGV